MGKKEFLTALSIAIIVLALLAVTGPYLCDSAEFGCLGIAFVSTIVVLYILISVPIIFLILGLFVLKENIKKRAAYSLGASLFILALLYLNLLIWEQKKIIIDNESKVFVIPDQMRALQ